MCRASDAGYVEYPSLPGAIKTGCINSPAFLSRFCTQHSPRSCVSKPCKLSESNLSISPIDKSHSHLNVSPSDNSHPKSHLDSGESVVELILEKKTTRSGTYYKVNTCLRCC